MSDAEANRPTSPRPASPEASLPLAAVEGAGPSAGHSTDTVGSSPERGYGTFEEDDAVQETSTSETLPSTPVDYDPLLQRRGSDTNNAFTTTILMMKGCLGTGILAMPMAFRNGGFVLGSIAFLLITLICTYCVRILVQCSHYFCRKNKVSKLDYAETASCAFAAWSSSYADLAFYVTKAFLFLYMTGSCAVYLLFGAHNIQQLIDVISPGNYWCSEMTVPILGVFVLILCYICRGSFMMALVTLVATGMMVGGLVWAIALICLKLYACDMEGHTNSTGETLMDYYALRNKSCYIELPPEVGYKQTCNVTTDLVVSYHRLPLFFGTAIFALEGIGVVMKLENSMREPLKFLMPHGVLNISMGFIFVLYLAIGMIGYAAYGEETRGSITLNLGVDKPTLGLRGLITAGVILTFPLQFKVPAEVATNVLMWIVKKGERYRFTRSIILERCSMTPFRAEMTAKVLLVCLSVALPYAITNLSVAIALVGALCLSVLGLMLPATIHAVTRFYEQKARLLSWWFALDVFIAFVGLMGLVFGLYSSIVEMYATGK